MSGDPGKAQRDRERIAEIRARFDEMQEEMSLESRRYAEKEIMRRDSADVAAPSSLINRRVRGLRNWAIVVGIFLASLLLIEVAMTLSRFVGNDFGDAKLVGRAQILACRRHGPIGQGIGYWYGCSVDVDWGNGSHEKIVLDKPGFFRENNVGKALTIGYVGLKKGGRSYAIKGIPPRSWLAWLSVILIFLAGVPIFLIAWEILLRVRSWINAA